MITNISLKNVRKFEKLNLNINSKNVLLFGSNAVGKTTILEAISLASITKSHRTNSLKEIIKEEQMFSDIKITYERNLYRVVISNAGKNVSISVDEPREDITEKEALEMVKKYDSPKAGGFVNGILRGIIRKNDESEEE